VNAYDVKMLSTWEIALFWCSKMLVSIRTHNVVWMNALV